MGKEDLTFISVVKLYQGMFKEAILGDSPPESQFRFLSVVQI